MFTSRTRSAQETQMLAEKIAKLLPSPFVIALNGDLGAGKTTFVQGFCRQFQVKDTVNSPTFTLVNNYQGAVPIQHIDFYRLNTIDEIELLGIDEYLPPQNGYTLIEWASHAPELLPKDTLFITFKDRGNDTRELSFTLNNPNKELQNKLSGVSS
ncbi:tRNA (adenosine(37)-N6)-threonylcarbamoyltransferase complex ATPase subunit type 1 TsaE [Candidatus Margulisiibacteriota bacterium]